MAKGGGRVHTMRGRGGCRRGTTTVNSDGEIVKINTPQQKFFCTRARAMMSHLFMILSVGHSKFNFLFPSSSVGHLIRDPEWQLYAYR